MERIVTLVVHIIALEKDGILRPDNGVRNLEVQIGFSPCIEDACRSLATIDGLENWMSTSRNFPTGESVQYAVAATEDLKDDIRVQCREEQV